jgi:ABC-type lipoprotein release transport system permease subunit
MATGFSRWNEAVRVAAGAIFAHRLRSMLTVIGIVIGIAVVTVVASLLEGAQGFINDTAAGLGPGIVRSTRPVSGLHRRCAGFAEARAKRRDISIEDYRGLRVRLADRLEVGARIDAALPVARGNRSLDGISIQG